MNRKKLGISPPPPRKQSHPGDILQSRLIASVKNDSQVFVHLSVFVQVDEEGEAAKCPDLRKGNLHIVSVGIVNRKEQVEADELLRQLMTLPRPVRVEFARMTDTTTPPRVVEENARTGVEKTLVGGKQQPSTKRQSGKSRREQRMAPKQTFNSCLLFM